MQNGIENVESLLAKPVDTHEFHGRANWERCLQFANIWRLSPGYRRVIGCRCLYRYICAYIERQKREERHRREEREDRGVRGKVTRKRRGCCSCL